MEKNVGTYKYHVLGKNLNDKHLTNFNCTTILCNMTYYGNRIIQK